MADKIKKDVKLIGREFGSIRQNLVDFTKTYFPQTFNDFNESSPGMMMLELSSYVGDVLSYYTDVQLRESILEQAQEKKNIFAISQAYGYKPKLNIPATTNMAIFQLVPAIGSGATVRPDWRYALNIKEGAKITAESNGDIEFNLTQGKCNHTSMVRTGCYRQFLYDPDNVQPTDMTIYLDAAA